MALGSADVRADVVDILKEEWPEGLEDELLFEGNPGLALIKQKKTSFGGRYFHQPIMFAKGQGRSASFANAQTNVAGPRYDAFDITVVNNYGVAQLEGLLIDQVKFGGGEDRFIDTVDMRCRAALSTLGDDLNHNFYRNTSGVRAQRASLASSTVTLSNADDIVFIEVDMVLVASASADGTSIRSGTASVTAVDRDAGTFDFTGTITGFADNDYLYVQGDPAAKAAGLDAWVPSSAPGATAFYGVDRSVDTERLGGVRFTGTGYEPEEMFIQAAARANRSKVKITHWLCHPNYYAQAETALQSRGTVELQSPNNPAIGFSGINIAAGGKGGKGVPLIQDPACQEGVVWGVTGSTWTWHCLGDSPRKVSEDGLDMLRMPNSDGFEIRFVSRSNWGSSYPGATVRCAV
jgi:hypothetical protein